MTSAARTRIGSRSLVAGLAGAAFLPALYIALISVAQGPDHALDQLRADLLFVAAVSIGFGTQVGMFVELRRLHAVSANARALTAAGAGTSTAAMLACCAHHLVDVLPLLGLSAAAALLAEYKQPLMLVSLATTFGGVVVMARKLADAQRCAVKLSGAIAGSR